MVALGSTGPVVKILQRALNYAETKLARLAEDGIFGPKTNTRVKEFQADNQLDVDGVVGPNTWLTLKGLVDLVSVFPTPQAELDARIRICSIAWSAYNSFGWRGEATPPKTMNTPSLRIAAKHSYGDPIKVPGQPKPVYRRHGGESLATIFRTAGVNADRCPYLTDEALKFYASGSTDANLRNAKDIPSWCGIFCLFVYRTAGLKTGTWVSGSALGSVKNGTAQQKNSCFLRIPFDRVQVGDVGIIEPQGGGRIHHILVVTKNELGLVETIEGNANTPQFQTIVHGRYQVDGAKKGSNGFPIKQLHNDKLAKAGESAIFLTPNWPVLK